MLDVDQFDKLRTRLPECWTVKPWTHDESFKRFVEVTIYLIGKALIEERWELNMPQTYFRDDSRLAPSQWETS